MRRPAEKKTWVGGARTLRERTADQFDYQRMLIDTFSAYEVSRRVKDLHQVLTQTSYRFLAVRLLLQDGDTLRAVREYIQAGGSPVGYPIVLAVEALASRDFEMAAGHLARATLANPRSEYLYYLRLYALCMSGEIVSAERIAARSWRGFSTQPDADRMRSWFLRTFDARI